MMTLNVTTIKKDRKFLKKLGFSKQEIAEIMYFRFEDQGYFNALNVVKTANGHIEVINVKTTRQTV